MPTDDGDWNERNNPDLAQIVREIADEMRARTDRGQVATYIPELANVDPAHFGIAVIDLDGNAQSGGDADCRSRSRASRRCSP